MRWGVLMSLDEPPVAGREGGNTSWRGGDWKIDCVGLTAPEPVLFPPVAPPREGEMNMSGDVGINGIGEEQDEEENVPSDPATED